MLDIMITILGLIILVLMWIALYDSNRFVVVSHRFESRKIKKKCRAVIIADLHNKCYGKENERLLWAIREQKPDFILIPGDIPTAKPGEKLDVAIRLIAELAKEYPIYYSNGNHEHRMKLYPDKYGDMNERYEEALRKAGVLRLVNSHVMLAECGICVFGAEISREYYKRFKTNLMGEGYMEEILGQLPKDAYNILLAHHPDYFPEYAAWGADLVVSGHVHGGMVRMPFWGKGVVSPSVRLFPKYDGGIFKQKESVMLLARGLGMHTIPVRIFNPGELLVIDLCPEE